MSNLKRVLSVLMAATFVAVWFAPAADAFVETDRIFDEYAYYGNEEFDSTYYGGGFYMDTDTLLISLLTSLILALIVTVIVVKMHKTSSTVSSRSYMRDIYENPGGNHDIYLRSHVNKVRKSSSDNDRDHSGFGGSISMGGGGHGGGGRSF